MKPGKYLNRISIVLLLSSCLHPFQAFCQETLNFAAMRARGIGSQTRVHFNSRLLSADGKALSGFHLLTFYIHTTEDRSDAPLWTETLPVETGENGTYSVDLMTSASSSVADVLDAHPLLYVSASIPGSSSLSEAQVITTIPQAIYQDCNLDGQSCSGPPGNTANGQLDKIAAANFSVVLNYSVFWGTKQEVLAYAAHANSLHVKIMWAFNDPAFAKYAERPGKYLIDDYSEISASCDCSSNRGFLEYLVNLVKDLPATYGYSVGDEPAPITAPNVMNLYDIIRAVDPKHPQMVNATWDNATNPSLGNLARHLVPFHFADILGADYYPVGTGAPVSDTATAADHLHTIATTYGKAAEMALQAFNWGQYSSDGVCSGSQCTYPTTSQLQTMLRDAAIGAEPRIIFWYDYWDTVDAGKWDDFVSAVNPQRLSDP